MDESGNHSSAAETLSKENHGESITGQVLVEWRDVDYRGFVFVLHKAYGLMLLRCTRKMNKGPHWQIPGGHIDKKEFLDAAEKEGTRENQLQLAGKAGVARELFEETGIYIRSQLDRFVPAKLRVIAKHNKDGIIVLANEYKHRLFYFLIVTDDDFAKQGVGAMGTDIVNSSCAHIKIKISMEHSGFTFQQNAENAIEMLSLHSGGKVSEAMKMALLQEDAVIFRNIFKADEISVGVQEKLETAESTSSSIQRRSKRDKDTTTLFSHQRGMTPALLPPLPEAKKNGFCCFGC